MSNNWDKYERAAEKGPSRVGIKIILLIAGLLIVGGVVFGVVNWLGEAGTVARQEFGPAAMLEKYQWFKRASAQLDRKKQDIEVYDQRIASMMDLNRGVPRNRWARADVNAYNQASAERLGLVSSFNKLAAEYNAQMAMFNWRFANIGELPRGADGPVQREYREYTTGQ